VLEVDNADFGLRRIGKESILVGLKALCEGTEKSNADICHKSV
jgi:hypothetical protein